MRTYNLYNLLKEELKNGSADLVTRPSGQVIRERIERDFAMEQEGEAVALDFSGIGVIDYSCADEIVAKLVSRLNGNEYGDIYIILTGLSGNQKENLEVALERKELAAVAEMRSGTRVIIGKLSNYLLRTLELVNEKGRITAGELSEILKVPPNTSGTRLLNLFKKRLVRRMDAIRDGGRVWVYEKI